MLETSVRRDHHQSFVLPDVGAEKKEGRIWGFSADFPVFKAEKGPQKKSARNPGHQ